MHSFHKNTRLEHFTLHPKLDQRDGLKPHSFLRRLRRGRIPSAATAKRELNIKHDLTHRETWLAPRGTKYHERPIRGVPRRREVIVHGPMSDNQFLKAQRLPQQNTMPSRIR